MLTEKDRACLKIAKNAAEGLEGWEEEGMAACEEGQEPEEGCDPHPKLTMEAERGLYTEDDDISLSKSLLSTFTLMSGQGIKDSRAVLMMA